MHGKPVRTKHFAKSKSFAFNNLSVGRFSKRQLEAASRLSIAAETAYFSPACLALWPNKLTAASPTRTKKPQGIYLSNQPVIATPKVLHQICPM